MTKKGYEDKYSALLATAKTGALTWKEYEKTARKYTTLSTNGIDMFIYQANGFDFILEGDLKEVIIRNGVAFFLLFVGRVSGMDMYEKIYVGLDLLESNFSDFTERRRMKLRCRMRCDDSGILGRLFELESVDNILEISSELCYSGMYNSQRTKSPNSF